MRAKLSFATSGGVTLRGTTCSTDELQCIARGGFTSGVLEPGRYVFGVNSLADTTVQVLAQPVAPGPFCGDGVRAPTETCDDGNPSAFDACNEQCQLVDQSMESTCGFAPLLTFAPVSATELAAATQSAQTDLDPTVHPSCFDGGTAFDISRFTLPVTSDLRIDTPQLSRDVGLAVFSGTCATLREERCTTTTPGQAGGEVLTATLDAGDYFVVVNSPGGAVRTKLTVAPH
jgi:cysteine-rich repeat protein